MDSVFGWLNIPALLPRIGPVRQGKFCGGLVLRHLDKTGGRDMRVSRNGGTLKCMVYRGKINEKMDDLALPLLRKPPYRHCTGH